LARVIVYRGSLVNGASADTHLTHLLSETLDLENRAGNKFPGTIFVLQAMLRLTLRRG